jgi:transposase
MPVNLYYTQKVRGFQQTSVKYSTKSVEISLKRTKHQCPHCGSPAVTVEPIRIRRIRGESLGSCRKVVLVFTIHRLYCHCCHHRETEHIPFLSHPKARLTKALERTILDKLDGIVTYWTFRHISNAKMEGFNNKIRWLIKQAYGFRDREYFKLKIYQLPETSSEKLL